MKSFATHKIAITFAVVLTLTGVAYYFRPEAAEGIGPWYSVVPPLVAIALAVITGQILPSLIAAVVVGGLLTTLPAAPVSIGAWGRGLDAGAGYIGASIGDSFNLQLLAFVMLVLTMIGVVVAAGGLHGVVRWLGRFAKGPRSAQLVTYLMGLLMFIDDYANTMIVGTAMRPITEAHRVSREKLAFLVDATSAPVAGLAVISTWVGYEVGLFADAANSLGIETTGYAMLFSALPFRFYCVSMLVFVFFTVATGLDFGPMRRAESRTRTTGEFAEPDAVPMTSATFAAAEPETDAHIHPISALLPIGFMFVFLLAGIWVDGGGVAVLRENMFGLFSFTTWREVIGASENSVKILAYGAGIALVLAWACGRYIGRLDNAALGRAAQEGFRGSLLPCVILVLAWSLKGACDGLGTGSFLVAAIGDTLNPAFFPAIVFVLAALTSFATGTSYGTMAILMPTAVPIAFALEGAALGVEQEAFGIITIITLASILDGSIVGDHCSPISDTTIMSSIASSCDHMHHVRTQLPYSLSVGTLVLCAGYIPAGFGMPPWVGFGIAIALMAALFAFLKSRSNEIAKPVEGSVQ